MLDDPELKKKKSESIKLPPVGTYNPDPVSFSLFSSISQPKKGKNQNGMGGKTERFKSPKAKKLPFYSVIS